MKQLLIASVLVLITACGGLGVNRGGPSVFTNPESYLKNVQLGFKTPQQLISSNGVPDKSFQDGETKYLSYVYGTDLGVREYKYVFRNERLIDVTYHDQGSYNGISAARMQSVKSL